jgi:hypothetical protein
VIGAWIYGWGIKRWLWLSLWSYGTVMRLNKKISCLIIYGSVVIMVIYDYSNIRAFGINSFIILQIILQIICVHLMSSLTLLTEEISDDLIFR